MHSCSVKSILDARMLKFIATLPNEPKLLGCFGFFNIRDAFFIYFFVYIFLGIFLVGRWGGIENIRVLIEWNSMYRVMGLRLTGLGGGGGVGFDRCQFG